MVYGMLFSKPEVDHPNFHLLIFDNKIYKLTLFNNTGCELTCTRRDFNTELMPVIQYVLNKNATFKLTYIHTKSFEIKCMSHKWVMSRRQNDCDQDMTMANIQPANRQIILKLRLHQTQRYRKNL